MTGTHVERLASPSRPITFRSSTMSHLIHEDLARAHLAQRIELAQHEREALRLARIERAQRRARRAQRTAERAHQRLRLLAL